MKNKTRISLSLAALLMITSGVWAADSTGEPGRVAGKKIYNVALSDKRKADPKTGKAPPVGNTVDIKTAKYTNSIGDTKLSAVWTDPDFDPKQRALYYVRVLEIPTPRWSTYDAVKLGVEPPKGVSPVIQERAWSSPIWRTPKLKTAKK